MTVVIVQDSVSTYVFTDFEINSSPDLHVGFSMALVTCICMYIYGNHEAFLYASSSSPAIGINYTNH